MNVEQLTTGLVGYWRDYSAGIILVALVATAAFLAVALFVSWRRGRVDRWVSTLAGISVLALSAEGMWVVATKTLGLPPVLAATVFFVAEAVMVNEAMQARRHYAKHKNPGKHGRAVWLIAIVAGGIVAMNSASMVEVPLRMALPLAWCLMWWNDLTADGVQATRSTWRWTPRRLLLAMGAIEPGERDAETINRDRLTAAMTVTAHRLHSGARLKGWHAGRLRRLARTADDAIVAEVRARVTRVQQITELTNPATVTEQAELAARRAEAEALKAELARIIDLAQTRDQAAIETLTGQQAEIERLRAEAKRTVERTVERPRVSSPKVSFPQVSRQVSAESVPVPADSQSVLSSESVLPADTSGSVLTAQDSPGVHLEDSAQEDTKAVREAARAMALAAIRAGRQITGPEVGRKFGQGPKWGQRRVKEARSLVASTG